MMTKTKSWEDTKGGNLATIGRKQGGQLTNEIRESGGGDVPGVKHNVDRRVKEGCE